MRLKAGPKSPARAKSPRFTVSRHRSASRGDLVVPITRTKTYGSRAFSIAGPATWNMLPASIREATTLSLFKAELKTFLFAKSYPN